MPYLNRVFLIGHLGGNPELILTNRGSYLWRLRLAVRRGRTDEADWFNVTIFDRDATKSWIKQKLHKGDLVFVEGEIHINQGEKRVFVDVVARRVSLLKEKQSEDVFLEEELDLNKPF